MKKNNIKLSAVIIARNEEKMIGECLESVKWVDEIVVVDDGSEDETVNIANKYGANVVGYKSKRFDEIRNKGTEVALGEWMLHIDADERVTPELRSEITKIVNAPKSKQKYSAYGVPRRNYIFGKEMKHVGLWPDYVIHFFKKESYIKWKGALHEYPEFKGKLGHLKNPLIHLKYDSLSEMVAKTNEWSETEAKLLYRAKHPRMSWWRFIRIMLTELWLRLVKQSGYRDGTEGVIYSFYQMWSKFITYAKLWEMQVNKEKG